MYELDQEKTEFITNHGLYFCKVIPFGLKNARATYQRLVNKIFKEQIEHAIEVYTDNTITKSVHANDHARHFGFTFIVLRQHNIPLSP